MFRFSAARRSAAAKLVALDKSQAVIEFTADGIIVGANENFLRAVGYTIDEVRGQHHRMFVSSDERESPDYREFWARLGRGEYQAAQYKRVGKGGREIWIEASYNPILAPNGKVLGVVKYATDVTEEKRRFADLLGKVNAIEVSQAVIEFELDGTIITANRNFLDALGYTLPEIQGKPHRMFVDADYGKSEDYAGFWRKLREGAYQSGQFRRFGKGGREIWIEASYNPVRDLNGNPVKVVKYATDVTRQVRLLADLKRLIDLNFGEIDQALESSAHQSGEAAGAASTTSTNVTTVASSTEELAASIEEISASMSKSRSATDSAFDQSMRAGEATQRLTKAASDMGGIVGLIQTIAGQINLLALNATIESARAGEAGKGFAVVATEVKNLANQAAKATEQIAREIDGIQSISGEVAASLDSIRGSVETMRDHVVATASAVEEQSVVMRGMSASMQDASSTVGTISQRVTGISAAIAQVTQAVTKTKEAARVLAR